MFRVIAFFITLLATGVVVLPLTNAGDFETPADDAAQRELAKTTWVRDLYVSPGHINIGVLRQEKDWNAPMIGKWVCGVLAKHGSQLRWVRFVDIEAVAGQGKSPDQAQISKFACR